MWGKVLITWKSSGFFACKARYSVCVQCKNSVLCKNRHPCRLAGLDLQLCVFNAGWKRQVESRYILRSDECG